MKSIVNSYFYIGIFTLFSFCLKGQSITGTVLDEDNQAIPFANIIHRALTDSTILTGTSADEKGAFILDLKGNPEGYLQVTTLGYDDEWIPLELGKNNYQIRMNNASVDLDEVLVEGRKVLYELKQDRVVVNVSASPAFSGNNALQLLQKSPGVIVNQQNGTVSMNAKGSVLVMINNKVQRIPTSVLLARLEGMQAEQVESIELIHQPSARYDASGAAGIIHIVLKENNEQGTNGNASVTVGYGQREKFGFNLGLNSRQGILNWYGNYSYNLNPMNNLDVNHFREYDFEGNDYYYENFVTLNDRYFDQHAVNLGLDISLSPSTVVGFLVDYSNSADIYDFSAVSNDFFNEVQRATLGFQLDPETRTETLIGNFNLFQKISPKSDLNFDLDYARLEFDNIGNIESTTGTSQDQILASRATPIDIWTVKLDNINQLSDNAKLEIGAKATISDISSTATVENVGNEEWVGNTLFSGTDVVNEKILAFYASFNQQFNSKLNGEFGFRFEHYDYELAAAIPENNLRQTFNNPFPIVRLNYKLDSLKTLQLTFNRTITRPTFSNIAAYFTFLDPSILVFGNPRLRPTFTNTYKVSLQNRSIIYSLAYLRTTNFIYYFNTVDKPNNIQTSTPSNLDLSQVWEANVSFPVYLTDWWDFNFNINVLYHTVEDDAKRAIPFENDIVTFTGQLNSSIRIGEGWSASFDGRYMSDFLKGDQVQFLYPYVNFGIRKQFDSGSSLSLSVQDITNTIGKIEWEYNQPAVGIRTFGGNNFSERQVRLTYAFNFGNQQLRAKRQRETGQDVNSRM